VDKKYLQLNDIQAYNVSFALSNYIWSIIIKWDYLAKDTVGKQFIRSVDSISANIAEGFGRYGKRDKIKFYHYSYGSIKESLNWNEKARTRELISQIEYEYILSDLNKLPKEINSLIKFTNERLTI
jgi:four helix bundle protein